MEGPDPSPAVAADNGATSTPPRSRRSEAWYGTTPPDFERFLALSGSRGRTHSLSPERELAQMTRRPPLATWQLGAPLWDPVAQLMRCPEGHAMHLCSWSTYRARDLVAITCDFCSHSRRLEPAGAKVELDAPFHHCDACDADLCGSCEAFIRSRVRFHVPCLRCLSCGSFVREGGGAAAAHRCGTPVDAQGAAAHAQLPPDAHPRWAVVVEHVPREATEAHIVRLLGIEHGTLRIEIREDRGGDERFKRAIVRFAARSKAEIAQAFVRRRRSTLPFACDAVATLREEPALVLDDAEEGGEEDGGAE